MSDGTHIEWTDASWPVVRGCTKCSEGCEFCWAIRDAHLHAGNKNPKVQAHFAGLTQIVNGRPNWTGEVRLDESILDWPLRWKQPRRIFVASSGKARACSIPKP
jgi:protein gp37